MNAITILECANTVHTIHLLGLVNNTTKSLKLRQSSHSFNVCMSAKSQHAYQQVISVKREYQFKKMYDSKEIYGTVLVYNGSG